MDFYESLAAKKARKLSKHDENMEMTNTFIDWREHGEASASIYITIYTFQIHEQLYVYENSVHTQKEAVKADGTCGVEVTALRWSAPKNPPRRKDVMPMVDEWVILIGFLGRTVTIIEAADELDICYVQGSGIVRIGI